MGKVTCLSVVVSPQVTGTITSMHENLVAGGLIQADEVLYRVDARDYRINVREQETQLLNAKAQLDIERGQQQIAKREWDLFKEQRDGSVDPSLALRKPQLEIAKVNIDAAQARLERAKLNISRTTVRAPFNGIVLSESAEEGQLVSTASQTVTLAGTDTFWVRTTVPMDKLAQIAIPGLNAAQGSQAEVVQDLGGQRVVRTGEVVRLLGELDPVGRMAQVLVAVEDPMALDEERQGTSPLLLGAFVSVEFKGKESKELVEVPRVALRDGDRVFVVSGDDTLSVRDVQIAWRRPDSVLVSAGVADGEQVVVSNLGAPVEGMKLRKSGDEVATKDSSEEATR
ncbi:MAG: efflux RND transporter periplasmic adaptor subunit [Myxococcota bacterium]